jgi:hypothetical protein
MPGRISHVLLVMFGSLLPMIGLLVSSAWLTYHGQASRLTDVLNVLAYAGIPFLVGVLVSWQWRHIPRGIATTFLIGLMGATWANVWALSFEPPLGYDFGIVLIEISVLVTIPYLLLGCLAGLCGVVIARLLGSSTSQNTAHSPD